mmetsp:Transcript_10965/g.20033  ORF Transcript_10965/g.20033 Transcript_10965/m.20033 type:complete len:217 (+) Transcript_10965:3918-4568(+)
MKILCKGLNEPISERLRHDLIIIIVIRFKLVHKGATSKTRYGEHSNVIFVTSGGDEVRLVQVWILTFFLSLLTQPTKGGRWIPCQARRFISKNVHIFSIFTLVGREHAYNALQAHAFVFDNLIQQCLGIVKKLFCFATNSFVIKDFRVSPVWITPSEFPGLEEWIPVNERDNIFERDIIQNSQAQLVRRWCRRGCIKINFELLLFGLIKGEKVSIL